MQTDLILAGNGPGELAGWIRPTAEAARTAAATDGQAVRLTLALLPTQFAGGAELETVQSWHLFDRIIPPMQSLRLAAGLGSLDVLPAAVLVHLGGDLVMSSRLASHLRIPACAFSETTLIASRHRRFSRIFVPTGAHATALRARGVPEAKIVVSGDPRAAAPAAARRDARLPTPATADDREIIALLPGSRDRLFRTAVPITLDIAAALLAERPQATFLVIVSPFITHSTLLAVQREAAARLRTLPLRWVTGNPWPDLMRTTVALTLPGTTTMELAAAGVPFAVVVDLDQIGLAAIEGPLDWVAHITGLHRLIKQQALNRYRRTMGYLALPNQRAGREIAPEWVGRWTPADVANRLNTLLDDTEALAAMSAALSQLYDRDVAAPSAIVAAAMQAAGSV